MSRSGLACAVVFFGALSVLPFAVGPQWILKMLIFTLMYAGLSSS